jgi:hypothetical protein
VAQSSLTEYIELVQPEIFGHVHIEMRDGITLWWKFSCRVGIDRLFRDQNSAGMY